MCDMCVSLSLSSNVKMMPTICRLNNPRNFNANDGFVVVSSAVPAQTSNKQHERNYFNQTKKKLKYREILHNFC